MKPERFKEIEKRHKRQMKKHIDFWGKQIPPRKEIKDRADLIAYVKELQEQMEVYDDFQKLNPTV